VANQQDIARAALGKEAWNKWAVANKGCDVDFSGHVFESAADFEGFNFPGVANFAGSEFTGKAHFSGATFAGTANFLHAIFLHYAALDRITFQGDVLLAESHFRGYAYAAHSTFGYANFKAATFFNLELTGSTFLGETDFTDATFTLPEFRGVQFKHPLTTFARATFREVPDFRNSRFDVPPILYGIAIDPPRNDRVQPEDGEKYRRLKLLASDAKDHQNELRFFADELRCKRAHETKGLLARWLNRAYELSSNYGQSIAWPFGLLLILIVFSGAVRVAACWPASESAISFSPRRTVCWR
jgi:hypothetical protein